MGPNDAQIVRIFSREEKGLIADFTLKANGNAEIVVEAEAGHTLHGLGGDYLVTLVIRDLSDGTLIPATVQTVTTPNKVVGRFRDSNWQHLAATFAFLVPATELSGRREHLLQAYGSVVYGNDDESGATLATSPLFMIQP
ncbi:hypothetical protein [Streptomyces sp. NPDC101234]|uniref:hypothetical protein n=1 Tax=Streptomyces sp. NPDC101234 TaxID=3366138 RepID=UPI00380EB2FB